MFIKWLTGDMGDPVSTEYPLIYWISLMIVILVLVAIWFIASSKKIDDKTKKWTLCGIAIFHLAFEVGWRIIYVVFKHTTFPWLWPMYPCNLGGVILPIIALTNWKTGKKIFYLFGFVGAILTFAMPGDIFNKDVMNFPILKSVLQHTGLLMIPLFEYASGTFRPSMRYYLWLVGGCLVHLFNCEVVDRWFGLEGDFMYMRSGLPFVIPGVPSWLTLSVFGLIVFAILSFILDYRDSIAFFKSFRKK